jgi:hypothetical protein
MNSSHLSHKAQCLKMKEFKAKMKGKKLKEKRDFRFSTIKESSQAFFMPNITQSSEENKKESE